MSVKYTDYSREIIAREELGTELAVRMALEDIIRLAEPNTPMKTGALRRSATIRASQGIVQWTADYSVFQENKQYARYTTPGTGPHFGRDAVDEVTANFDQYLRKTGVIR